MTVISESARRVYLTRVRDFVGGATFPASRSELITFTRKKNTPSEIMSDLMRLPAERYDSLSDVVAAIDTLRFGVRSA